MMQIDWESKLRKPGEDEEWYSLDVLAEVCRVAIEFEDPRNPVIDDDHHPKPRTEDSKKNLGFDGFTPRNAAPTRMLKIQEPDHQDSSSSSSSSLSSSSNWICIDCFKRKRRQESGDNDSGEKTQSKKHKKSGLDPRPSISSTITGSSSSSSPPREIPAQVRNLMRDMNGVDPKLIIKKNLYKTDLSPNHGRVSMPIRHIIDRDFLKPEEERIIDERNRDRNKDIDVGVILIDPSSRTWELNLRRWDMAKTSGKLNASLVLTTGWKHVYKANRLKEGDAIELWTFRSQQKLHFCLLLPERA